jgi:hypothetical protein
MQNPDFADLAMFVRVADAGGFRAAASRYGVSASSQRHCSAPGTGHRG